MFEALDVPWTTPMRTLLVLIDDSTNLTSTSTVPFSTYETDVSVGIKQFIDAGTVQLEKKLHLYDLILNDDSLNLTHLIKGLIQHSTRFFRAFKNKLYSPNILLSSMECKTPST